MKGDGDYYFNSRHIPMALTNQTAGRFTFIKKVFILMNSEQFVK